MKLSVVIPAHNEEGSIEATIIGISKALTAVAIDHEIIVVNDNSQDKTEALVKCLRESIKELHVVNNAPPNGFGLAIRKGLQAVTGQVVVIAMADASDSPDDIVSYFRKIEEGYDCVFGSRFIKGSVVSNYPKHKLLLNRMANLFVRLLCGVIHTPRCQFSGAGALPGCQN